MPASRERVCDSHRVPDLALVPPVAHHAQERLQPLPHQHAERPRLRLYRVGATHRSTADYAHEYIEKTKKTDSLETERPTYVSCLKKEEHDIASHAAASHAYTRPLQKRHGTTNATADPPTIYRTTHNGRHTFSSWLSALSKSARLRATCPAAPFAGRTNCPSISAGKWPVAADPAYRVFSTLRGERVERRVHAKIFWSGRGGVRRQT